MKPDASHCRRSVWPPADCIEREPPRESVIAELTSSPAGMLRRRSNANHW